MVKHAISVNDHQRKLGIVSKKSIDNMATRITVIYSGKSDSGELSYTVLYFIYKAFVYVSKD